MTVIGETVKNGNIGLNTQGCSEAWNGKPWTPCQKTRIINRRTQEYWNQNKKREKVWAFYVDHLCSSEVGHVAKNRVFPALHMFL
jgi:hypothetical protein